MADGADILHFPVQPLTLERFTLRAWADGYVIYDGRDLICTFHGPQIELAWKVLRLLEDDAAKPPVGAA